jgi:hypothetical protein
MKSSTHSIFSIVFWFMLFVSVIHNLPQPLQPRRAHWIKWQPLGGDLFGGGACL